MLAERRDVSLVREPALWTPRNILQRTRDFSPPQQPMLPQHTKHTNRTVEETFARSMAASRAYTSDTSDSDTASSFSSPTSVAAIPVPNKALASASSLKRGLLTRWWTAGEAFVVGAGDVGQLGLGPSVTSRRKWAKVPHLPDLVVDVCCGGSHTLLLTTAHQIYSFGNNDDGALGRIGDETIPHAVGIPKRPIRKMVASDNASLVLYENGQLWGWGTFRGANGGLPSEWLRRRPLQLALGVADDWPVDVAAGNNHFLILMASGTLLGVGVNSHGQLGLSSANFPYLSFPTTVPLPKGVRGIKQMSCGGYHSLLITAEGSVFACGSHNYGQLGIGALLKDAHRATSWRQVRFDRFVGRIASVAAGEHHTLFLAASGHLYAAGRNSDAQCGLSPAVEYTLTPQSVEVPEAIVKIVVGLGAAHNYAIGVSGRLYAFGYGPSGQLGVAPTESQDSIDIQSTENSEPIDTLWQPTHVPLKGRQTLTIAAGGQHTVALLTTKD